MKENKPRYSECDTEVTEFDAPDLPRSPRHKNLLSTGRRFFLVNQEPAKFSSGYSLKPSHHKSFFAAPSARVFFTNALLCRAVNVAAGFRGASLCCGKSGPKVALRESGPWRSDVCQ